MGEAVMNSMLNDFCDANQVLPHVEKCETCNGCGQTIEGLRPGFLMVDNGLRDETVSSLHAHGFQVVRSFPVGPAMPGVWWVEIAEAQHNAGDEWDK